MLPGLIAGFSLLHSSHVAPFFPQKSIWFPRDTALFLHLLEAVDDSWWSRSVGDNPVKVEFMSVLGAARKASVSLKPNPEKAITNLIFWWCSNNWSQDTDIRPSGVSPVTSDSPAISPRESRPWLCPSSAEDFLEVSCFADFIEGLREKREKV